MFKVTIDHAAIMCASNHFISSSFIEIIRTRLSSVTLESRDIMLGQASLKCNYCCLLSSINNLIYGVLCKSHEFTACIMTVLSHLLTAGKKANSD